MTMTVRAGALLLALLVAGCGQSPFAAPARVKTHGYRALVTIKAAGQASSFELAARGEDRRKEPASEAPGKVLIWRGKEKVSYELDPASKACAERPFTSIDEVLPAFPLEPGFSDRIEAARRGIEEYRRESDTVFAGHACRLWRFDDKPGDDLSPSTTYWVAPDLDDLVVRVDREVPKPDGERPLTVTQLTNVRVNAPPELFEVPAGCGKK